MLPVIKWFPRLRVKPLRVLLLTLVAGFGLTFLCVNYLARASSPAPIFQEPQPTPGAVDAVIENPDPERLQRLEEAAISVSPPLVPESDSFGYTMISGTFGAAEWYTPTANVPITFSTPDDSVLVNIGFPFRYYENTYTQLYLNDNGLISFGNPATYAANDLIPVDVPPNNYIAGFWDSLDVGYNNNGAIYYDSFGVVTGNHYFVAEWYNVTRYGGVITDTVTFEIILSEISGDITILYKDVNIDGSLASVGIEDSDGIDGLQYMYRQTGAVKNGKKVEFLRPDNAETLPRVRVLPTYSGKMVVNNEATFNVQIRNTSNLPFDTYDILYSAPPAGWSISLLNADGSQLLQDTNSTGVVDTGSMGSLTTKTITVKIKTSSSVLAGAYYNFTLTARSGVSPYPTAIAQLQAAVPLNMTSATAYYDALGNKSAFLNLIWKFDDHSTAIQDPFLGNNPAVARKPDKGYVYAWDNPSSPDEIGQNIKYREIRFMILSQFGTIVRGVTDVDDHLSPYEYVYDGDPVVSVDPNGRIGFAWVRTDGATSKRDIYFALRDASGNPVGSVIKVTNNLGTGEVNESPAMAATANNFVLAWIHEQSSESPGEIWYVVCSNAGTSCTSPSSAAVGDTDYSDPSLTTIGSSMALLAYSRNDGINPETISYRVFVSNTMQPTEYSISGAEGWGPHALQLPNQKVVLAWTTSDLRNINYMILPADVQNPGNPPIMSLAAPNNRQVGYVSLGNDAAGRGILIWIDIRYSNFIFYAAMQSDGSALTPPMSYMGGGTNLSLYTSENGQGVASYDGAYREQLPFLRR
jgi:hypothetical protein